MHRRTRVSDVLELEAAIRIWVRGTVDVQFAARMSAQGTATIVHAGLGTRGKSLRGAWALYSSKGYAC